MADADHVPEGRLRRLLVPAIIGAVCLIAVRRALPAFVQILSLRLCGGVLTKYVPIGGGHSVVPQSVCVFEMMLEHACTVKGVPS